MTVCTALNNLLRGFVAYAAALAGYTAAMVSLLDIDAPQNVLALGLDRFLTVIAGVGVAMVIGVIFAPKADISGLRRTMKEVVADILTVLAEGNALKSCAALIERIAAVEKALELQATGSLRP